MRSSGFVTFSSEVLRGTTSDHLSLRTRNTLKSPLSIFDRKSRLLVPLVTSKETGNVSFKQKHILIISKHRLRVHVRVFVYSYGLFLIRSFRCCPHRIVNRKVQSKDSSPPSLPPLSALRFFFRLPPRPLRSLFPRPSRPPRPVSSAAPCC